MSKDISSTRNHGSSNPLHRTRNSGSGSAAEYKYSGSGSAGEGADTVSDEEEEYKRDRKEHTQVGGKIMQIIKIMKINTPFS